MDVERVEHRCEVCGKRAAFGFGVRVRRGKMGTWRCFEHRSPFTFEKCGGCEFMVTTEKVK